MASLDIQLEADAVFFDFGLGAAARSELQIHYPPVG